MARKRISEYRAKSILLTACGLPFNSYSYDSAIGQFADHQKSLNSKETYVIKVDAGVKQRFKKGLMKVNVFVGQIADSIKELEQKGYTTFLIEEFVPHPQQDERYISIERVREGFKVLYSKHGGVDIEDNKNTIQEIILPTISSSETTHIASELEVSSDFINRLVASFDTYYFSFVEINPLVIAKSSIYFLDCAAEVDSTGEFFVGGAWTPRDFIESSNQNYPEVENVKKLASKSTAAFSLTVLNPDGAVGMLLSSGGASIILADEVGNLGFGKELLNYGEYSGGPNAQETYIYAKNILSLLIKSKSTKKVLIIAGGVANFTDIRITFRGVIAALEEVKGELQKQNIKVYVRRGGPSQAEGLAMMSDYLKKENLFGEVRGPEMILTEIVDRALK